MACNFGHKNELLYERKVPMNNAIQGKNQILMFRSFAQRGNKGAAKLALQTKHTWKYESKSSSELTKDGNVNAPTDPTVTLELEALSSRDDVNSMLMDAAKFAQKLEVWDIDISQKNEDGKYNATYGQGYLQSWEVPSEVGKFTSIKTTMNIDQLPQTGEVTLSQAQEAEVQYAFADITAQAKGQ